MVKIMRLQKKAILFHNYSSSAIAYREKMHLVSNTQFTNLPGRRRQHPIQRTNQAPARLFRLLRHKLQ